MTDLFASVVNAIKDSVEVSEFVIDDVSYPTKELYLPPAEPTTKPLKIHTLSGVGDYIKSEIDLEDTSAGQVCIHVVSPTLVRVTSGLVGRHKIRDVYLEADCETVIGRSFRSGEWVPTDKFVVDLLSLFVADEALTSLIAVLGNIQDEKVKQLSDDGVSQQVTTRAGIRQLENARVPSRVTLRPYRTFAEVEQPQCDFVLRLKSGAKEGELPSAALFESDGGRWRLSAIKAIAAYLEELLPKVAIIA